MPWEMDRRQYLFEVISRTFEKFGFAPLETPAFESWELLGAKGSAGEAVRDEVYVFKDKGGRELGLRFDLTVPLARVVASNPQLQKPFKRYQIGPVWRYDNPQAGRFREFWQADADIVGSSSMAADAECIAVFASCLKELGFKDFEVRLNNRKVLNGMIEAVGVKKNKVNSVFRALDKLEKHGKEVVMKDLKKAGASPKQISSLFSFIEISGKPKEIMDVAREKLDGFLDAKTGLDEIDEIIRLSRSYGIADKIIIDFSLVRGLDYYTGPIYEIKARTKKGKDVGSLAGCGRYDGLIELFGGQPSPATGGSLGIERIYEIMIQEGMFMGIPDVKTQVLVAVVDENPKLKAEAIKIAQRLRAAGINVETDVMGRRLKKGLEYADNKGIPYMIIIGEKELKSGRLVLKDLKKRVQKSMGFESALKTLKR
jgi:histidyl-tRNA synthetase